jgi:hypothetical protein
MAFCNSCGATLTDGAQFCNKCGASTGVSAAKPSTASYTAPPPSKSSNSGLKIVLIVVGVLVLFGILSIVAVGVVFHRVLKASRYTQNGEKVKIETPLGTLEANKDPQQVAKDLGVDIYPGATMETNGSASTTIGAMHSVTATFESEASVDKICAFYKSKFPSATPISATQDLCSLVSNSPPNMVTVNIQSHGDGSRFQITSVTKKGTSSN